MLGETVEELVEVMAGELPGERLGDSFVVFLKGHEAVGQNPEISKVIGVENLALDYREVDLDLIEPAGVSRKVDEPQVGPGTLQPIDGGLPAVAAAIVHDPEHPIGASVGFLSHYLIYQSLPKGSIPFFGSQRPKSFARCTSQAAR